MKVMMLAPGASVHSVRPLRWLLERDCDVLFVDEVRPRIQPFPKLSYAPYPLGNGRLRWLGWRFSHLVGFARLTWLRRAFRADVVHVHWADDRAEDCRLAGLKPLVLTVWGSDVNLLFEPKVDPAYRATIGRALAGADLVLVDAPDMPEKCAQIAGRPVKTAVLALGVDTERFRPGLREARDTWRQRLSIPADATVLLSARAWGPRYGHDHILQAFADARRQCSRPMVLVFKVYNAQDYPDAGDVEARVRRMAAERGVEADVRWLFDVAPDDLPGLYSFADVVLNYPSVDAFPVTFIEAAACQCPVISIDLPAYRGTFASEFFRMVPADDPSELVRAMVDQVLADPLASRQILGPARDLVVAEFDEKMSGDRLLNYYRSVLQA